MAEVRASKTLLALCSGNAAIRKNIFQVAREVWLLKPVHQFSLKVLTSSSSRKTLQVNNKVVILILV